MQITFRCKSVFVPSPHRRRGLQKTQLIYPQHSDHRPSPIARPLPQRFTVKLISYGRVERKRTVVIVGGGIAGALLAKSIDHIAHAVLIDPKEYFEIPWANLRSRVEPSFAERSVIGHREYLKNGRLIISTAVGVTDQGVVTAEGRVVGFDYLVIATGHPYNSIRGRRDRLEKFQEGIQKQNSQGEVRLCSDNQKIKCSDSIMIVGGGATGVELAGEIAMDFPEKKVTLVHNGPRLLQFIGQKAGSRALEWLKSKNVQVLLEQSIDVASASESDREFRTSAGETVTADCYFLCVGKPVGSGWLRESALKEYLDRKGRLMVDENFRVGGLHNIFAIGDITDVPELKQGMVARRHALVVAKSLKLLLKGEGDCRLCRYRPSLQAQAWVSLGRKDAVVQYSFLTVSGFVPGMFRSRDLFVGKMRKSLGLEY
ncbi:hypothetical protein KSP40_PGU021448 [Platanthera guangdongensis]|uniref:FAD/NAD(P)-binding domain-containing protein n=1 Tax=Platanthera guangdongensis TaxID=2320717 RepID=A0ABR2MSL6_9ASPA